MKYIDQVMNLGWYATNNVTIHVFRKLLTLTIEMIGDTTGEE